MAVKHETSEDGKVKCPKCGKDFKQKDFLRKHIKIVHSEDRPFCCQICQAKFKTKACLQVYEIGILN